MKKKKKAVASKVNQVPDTKRLSRAGESLSSISSKIYFIIVSLTAIISALLYVFTIVIPEEERSERFLDIVFSNYAELAESSITVVTKRLDVIARSPDVINSLAPTSTIDRKELEANLTKLLPKAIGVRLVKLGTLDIDMESVPPISNVTLELLRKSGRGQKQPPEVVRVGQPDQYIAMVENVLAPGGDIVGYVLAGIDISIINDGLQEIRSIPGYIEFRQVYSGSVHILGSVGNKALKQGKALNISSLDNSLWQMAYWPTPEEDFTAQEEQFIFIAGLTAIFLLISVLGFIGYKGINDTLNTDASALMRLILDNPEGNIEIPPNNFILRIFYDMSYTLQRASNERIANQQAAEAERESQQSTSTNTTHQTPGTDSSPPPNTAGAQVTDQESTGAVEVANKDSVISPSIFRAYDIRGIVGET